jgi:CRP-like cAMP-binding protein
MRSLSPGAPLRDAMPLSSRVARFVRLPPDEAAMLRKLQSPARTIQRGRKFVAQGKKCEEVFIIMAGVGIRYRVLNDGRRQITRFIIPGDIEGCNVPVGNALFSTMALTEMVVVPVSHSSLSKFFEAKPRLQAKILMSFFCDASIDAERLIDLGRRSALERIAHFLLELLTRLQAIGLADEDSFQLPLTQELISDALGLSVTHVNRVFQQLRSDNLAHLADQKVVITDVARLCALADFDPTYLQPRLPSDIFDNVA